MTRYYVDMAPDLVRLITEDRAWLPSGLRLVSRFGPRTGHMERWIAEDDGAPAELEDYLILLCFSADENGVVSIVSREIQD